MNEHLGDEQFGIRYYPPKSSTGNHVQANNKKAPWSRRQGAKGSKKPTTKSAHLESSSDDEKEQAGLSKIDHELFRDLATEMEYAFSACLKAFYADTLNSVDVLLSTSSQDGLLPALFLQGQCLDWDWLFGQVKIKHPDLTIRRESDNTLAMEAPDEEASEVSRQLIFLSFSFSTKSSMFERLISNKIENRYSCFLLFHTSTTFSVIEECLPRKVFTQMHVNCTQLPSTKHFLYKLFIDQLPLGILRESAVQIHGNTLLMVLRLFQHESRSLVNVRKALLLALLDYATTCGFDKRPKEEERKRIVAFVLKYSVTLNMFILLIQGNGEKVDEIEKFERHCQIQSRPECFLSFYSKQKENWKHWTNDAWCNKFALVLAKIREFGTFFKDYCMKCEELALKLGSAGEAENEPPQKPETSSSARKSSLPMRKTYKSTQFLEEQQRKRSRLTNPIQDKLRVELFKFFDSLFIPNLHQFPREFIAGPGDMNLLGGSLSSEVDRCLGQKVDAQGDSQLDIVIAYQLLVDHNSESYTAQLSGLEDTFCQLVSPIDEMDSGARFMAAISQLEHMGVVVRVSHGVVRLIYLPSVILTKDLFEKDSKTTL